MNVPSNFFELCVKSKIDPREWFLEFSSYSCTNIGNMNLLNNLGSRYTKILDVGTGDGFIGLLMNYQNNNTVIGVDKSTVIGKNYPKRNFFESARITHIIADVTQNQTPQIINEYGPFDCIFIDSDSHYEDPVLANMMQDRWDPIFADKYDIIISCTNGWNSYIDLYHKEIAQLLKNKKDIITGYTFYPTRIGYLCIHIRKSRERLIGPDNRERLIYLLMSPFVPYPPNQYHLDWYYNKYTRPLEEKFEGNNYWEGCKCFHKQKLRKVFEEFPKISNVK